MADVVEPPKPRKKKALPPLTGASEPANGETIPTATRPKKKKAKPKTTEFPGPATEDTAASPVTEGPQVEKKPRKKKPRAKPTSTEESPQHDPGAGASTENLIQEKKPTRKTKRPQAEGRLTPEGKEDGAGEVVPASPPNTRTIDVRGMPLAEALLTVKTAVGQDNKAFSSEIQVQKEDEEDEDIDDNVEEVVTGGQSIQADKIFFQTQDTRFFKEEPREVYQARLRKEKLERDQYLLGEEGVEDSGNKTLQFAVGFTKSFNYLGTLLIGILSGVSLMHTVYVWGLDSTSYLSFLADYNSYAQPMSLIYYIGITLITLSVLERYDYGRLQAKACLECLSFKHAGMIIIIVLPCYVISNAMTPSALWMHRYSHNTTAYRGLEGADSIVRTWKILDAARAICLVILWMVVAFNPDFNKLSVNLQSELDDAMEEDGHHLTPTHTKA